MHFLHVCRLVINTVARGCPQDTVKSWNSLNCSFVVSLRLGHNCNKLIVSAANVQHSSLLVESGFPASCPKTNRFTMLVRSSSPRKTFPMMWITKDSREKPALFLKRLAITPKWTPLDFTTDCFVARVKVVDERALGRVCMGTRRQIPLDVEGRVNCSKVNTGLKVNRCIQFSCIYCFSLPIFCLVWDCLNSMIKFCVQKAI